MRRPASLLIGTFMAVLLLLGGCLRALPSPSPAPLRNQPFKPRRIPLGVLLYLTKGFDEATGESRGGLGSSEWGDNEHDGHVGAVYQPLFGFYASDDPEVIARQAEAMKRAGIDWVLLSWQGSGDLDLDGTIDSPHYQAIDRAVGRWFDYVKQSGIGLRLALVVEPFMRGRIPDPRDFTPEKKRILLDDIWTRYYRPYREHLYFWEGKPLLVFWSPGRYPLGLKETGDPRFTFREWGDPGRSDWSFVAFEGLEGVRKHIAEDGTVWICPRYDEFFYWIIGMDDFRHKRYEDLVRLDPTLEEGFYDRAWEIVFENRERVRQVIIYAWNSYGDQAFIEPAERGPFPPGWTLVEKTAYYHRLLEEGGEFVPFAQGRE